MIEHSEVWAPMERESDRERVLRGTVDQNKDLVLEGAQARVQGKAAAWRDSAWEIAAVGGAWPFKDGDFVSVRFVYEGEDYFFKSVATLEAEALLLAVPEQIFQLQKRKHFRIVLPEDFPARFTVLKREHGDVPLLAGIMDINDFGLRFRCQDRQSFVVGEKIEGTFRLGERATVTVAAVVRQTGDMGGNTQVGVEFDFHALSTADKVQAAILFYRHDIFHFRRAKK